ncbi:glycosyltransferase [Pseudobacteriovorax antillogorgiicola]|uniref:Glycosyltransferase, GT2 family n=1 Tax=Pseudobacteriovorax antillogorgiicola TaxID=1513793 RepID=A0A1Y6CLW9_9BACT|nr:glycosyltransferase [Pseudobacteriovorax antillogorgiicola]TCS45240.1 GT2 family glycosyltransferase [Pseudobacteriovorax antillogorgiicola]SMF75264.1 Glycosyltransferase, GT2 family [Pseudobacteriovorax antillogorgiicola]
MGLLKKSLTTSRLLIKRDWSGLGLRLAKYGFTRFIPSHITSRPEKVSFTRISKDHFSKQAQKEYSRFLFSDSTLKFPLFETPSLSIVIILYNKAELSFLCLQSLLGCVGEVNAEIIIIDNCSIDSTNEILKRIKNCTVIRNRENIGFLKGCNQAFKHVRAPNILFLNNDTVVYPGTLFAALKTIQSDGKIGAVGGRVVLTDGSLQEAGNVIWRDGTCHAYGRGCHPHSGEFMFERDTDYCSGAFLLTRSSLFSNLGMFDEQFAPAYYEETDYCIELQKQGYKVVYQPRAVITHFEFGSAQLSNFALSMMNRNRVKFLNKHKDFLKSKPLPGVPSFWNRTPTKMKPRLLFIDDSPPVPFLGAGFPRSLQILKQLSNDFFVTIYPTIGNDCGWHEIYSELPRCVEIISSGKMFKLRSFIEDRSNFYQYIWVSRPHNMSYFADHCLSSIRSSSLKVIYDAEAIFTNRELLERKVRGKAEKSVYRSRKYSEFELAKLADFVTAVSKNELKQLSNPNQNSAFVIGHDLVNNFSSNTFENRKHLVFLGSIHGHPTPNSDSIIWFMEKVFPLIKRELPEIKLVLVGYNRLVKNSVFRKYESNLVFAGRVDNLKVELSKYRVMVVPTRFAAGIPQKAYDACSYGLPCVVTPIIEKQMGWSDNINCLTAAIDNPGKFAEDCIRLYNSKHLWDNIRRGISRYIADQHEEGTAIQTKRLVNQLLQNNENL